MIGYGIFGYWSQETIHYSSHHCNNGDISDDAILEVSACDGRRVDRSLDTSHCSSRNHGVNHSGAYGRG